MQHELGIVAKNILIIENDEKLVEILSEFFSEYEYNLKFVPQAHDIRPLVKEFKADLVLLDFLLPGLNGGELCLQIKRSEELKNIPVIIYSSFPKVMLSLGDYGCNAFVPKPFNLEDLMLQMEACMNEPERSYLFP